MIAWNSAHALIWIIVVLCKTKLASSNNCEEFSLSSIESNLLKENTKQQICVNGWNDTVVWAIWADVEIKAVAQPNDAIYVVSETSCEKVIERYKNDTSSYFSAIWKRSYEGSVRLSFSPYGTNCFLFYVNSQGSWKSLEVKYHRFIWNYLFATIVGLIFFFKADEISRSIMFYYTAGVSLGMIMALFLLLFIVSKFLPKRGLGYAFMFCGSSIVLYVFQVVGEQFFKGNQTNYTFILAYFIIAGLISFLYCYYRGPIQSSRGIDIMRWSLQSLALVVIYYSIRCEKISLTVTIILVCSKWISFHAFLHYVLSRGWIPYRIQSYLRGPRFISVEEYEKQGILETAKALKELREYCQSPECNTWKTVSRLKSPKRFASFMSDGADITLEERNTHDEASFDYMPFLTSDEDSQEELDYEEL